MRTQAIEPSYGWVDTVAVSMSMICAVHCLLTPILVVFLPIIATSFWVHQDFHIWMILLVVPTTAASIVMGCRKHHDKTVLRFSLIGLSILIASTGYEFIAHWNVPASAHGACTDCTGGGDGNLFTVATITNVLGGIFLAVAHTRNFLLCRKATCTHDH